MSCVCLSHAIKEPCKSSALQATLARLRGGDNNSPSYYELNPNYRGDPFGRNRRIVTLGDFEADQRFKTFRPSLPRQFDTLNAPTTYQESSASRPRQYHAILSSPTAATTPPIMEIIRDFFQKLHESSPTLHYVTLSSLILFITWQIPSLSFLLQRHFVCSRFNVLTKKRLHATLLSCISHASLPHLFLNMYGFIVFGTSVKRVLHVMGNLPLWPFVLGASLFSATTFLLCDNTATSKVKGGGGVGGGNGCIGLSGVTLALMAFDAMAYPHKEVGMMLSFIPVRLPARHALVVLLGGSLFGMFKTCGWGSGSSAVAAGGAEIAHAAHLGGLIFGVLYYEALARGWLVRLRSSSTWWWFSSRIRRR